MNKPFLAPVFGCLSVSHRLHKQTIPKTTVKFASSACRSRRCHQRRTIAFVTEYQDRGLFLNRIQGERILSNELKEVQAAISEIEDIYDTDYEIGQDNVGKWGFDLHSTVFSVSALLILLFVIGSLISPEQSKVVLDGARSWVQQTFDWLFLSAGNVFVLFCLALIVSPLGGIRLGGEEARPDFTILSWLAMLFAAGMGIGLMFWSVAEPVGYFTEWFGTPLNIEGFTEESKKAALGATMYHWGLHPWAIYGVVALSLAFFTYNKGMPLTIRSTFFPLLGDRVWGWPGDVIDTLAVLATIFGLATSLGLGAQQAAKGMSFLFDVDSGLQTQIVIIAAVTAVAIGSVVRGIEGGVKLLSNLNMALAAVLLIFIILAGGLMAFFANFGTTVAGYAEYLLPLSSPVGREDDTFYHRGRSFSWAWWISWSPFVGMFIARVSRGRTVREFIICVLIIPTTVCILWMTVFGGTALNQVVADGYTGAQDAALELKLFKMLAELPLATITSVIGIVLVDVFFVTSSDSGSLVIDTITAGGKVDAPVSQRIFWCIFEGAVAIVLLIGGGLAALQSAVISTGLPFTLVLLVMCYAIWKGLAAEKR